MVLVVALLGYCCLVGLTAPRLDGRARWRLLAGITVLIMIDFARRSLQ